MSGIDSWMPLYVGKYLAATGHLTPAEHGAYLLLLMHYWSNGPLPNDDKSLAAIARTSRIAWGRGVGSTIRGFFHVGDDGRLHQRKADKELTKATDISTKRAAAARSKHHQTTTKQDANEEQTQSKCTSDAHPFVGTRAGGLQLHLPKEEDSDLRSAPKNGAVPTIRETLWRDGLPIIRSLIGKSDTQARTLLGKLLKLSHDDCARVYAALREAETLKPIDPSAWLTRAATPPDERGSQLLAATAPDPNHPELGHSRFPRPTGLF